MPGTRQIQLSLIIFFEKLAQPARTVDYLPPPSLSASTSIQTHSRRKLSWQDLGSEAKTRAFLPRKYGSEGVPRATPTAASPRGYQTKGERDISREEYFSENVSEKISRHLA